MATLYKASPAKSYNFGFLLILFLFLAAIICFRKSIPLFYLLLLGGFLAAGSILTLLAIVSPKNVIEVTDEGVIYHPHFFPLLEFKDIAEIKLLPRVRELPDGTILDAIREAWRPVIIRLRDFEKYSARLPGPARSGVRDADDPHLARLEITFQGLTGDARDFYRIVNERVSAQ